MFSNELMAPVDEFNKTIQEVLSYALSTGNVDFPESNLMSAKEFTISTPDGKTIKISGVEYFGDVSKFSKIEVTSNGITNIAEYKYLTDSKLETVTYKLQGTQSIEGVGVSYLEKVTMNMDPADPAKIKDTTIVNKQNAMGTTFITNMVVDSNLDITSFNIKMNAYGTIQEGVLDTQTGILTQKISAGEGSLYEKFIMDKSALSLKDEATLGRLVSYYTVSNEGSAGWDFFFNGSNLKSINFFSPLEEILFDGTWDIIEGLGPNPIDPDYMEQVENIWSKPITSDYTWSLLPDDKAFQDHSRVTVDYEYDVPITNPFNQSIIDRINNAQYFNELHTTSDFSNVDFGENAFDDFNVQVNMSSDFELPDDFEIPEEDEIPSTPEVTETTKTDKNGNEVKTKEISAYVDENGVYHPAQVIEEGLNDSGNPYTVTKTQNADGTWTGKRIVTDKEKGYTRYEADITYNEKMQELIHNGISYDESGKISYKTEITYTYNEKDLLNSKIEITIDSKGVKTEISNTNYEYYPNGNIKEMVRKYYNKNDSNPNSFNEGNPYTCETKNQYYENNKLKTESYVWTDTNKCIISTTDKTFDDEGGLIKEVEVEYPLINSLYDVRHSTKGISYDRTPQYDSQGNLTGYVVSKSVTTGEKLGTYLTDKDGNWISNISTEDCDGKIGYFNQKDIGSCQMLTTLIALDNNDVDFVNNGTLTWHADGSVTVRFYEVDNFSMPTNNVREYTFSAKEITENKFEYGNGKIAYGTQEDRTVAAIERAFVTYNIEKRANGDTSKLNSIDEVMIASQETAMAFLYGKDKIGDFSPEGYTISTDIDMNEIEMIGFKTEFGNTGIPLINPLHTMSYLTKDGDKYYIQDTSGYYIEIYGNGHAYAVEKNSYNKEKNTIKIIDPYVNTPYEVNADIIRYCFSFIDFKSIKHNSQ